MSGDSILGGIGISRENLLDGMPARRASTILFAIENLTHQLVTRSRRALARYQPAASAQDRERQFIDAVSGGRDESSARPAVQDLERYATEWTPHGPRRGRHQGRAAPPDLDALPALLRPGAAHPCRAVR